MNRRTLHPSRQDPAQPCFIHLDVHTKYDEEVKRWVAGTRRLDVWSSGNDPKEALDRAEDAIYLFLNELERLGTIWQILEEAGIRLQIARIPEPEPVLERIRDAVRMQYSFPIAFQLPTPGPVRHAE